MSQATFLNRQALYLRPDPARVVVRPFRPATEPRDLNPIDRTRANHIVHRVLALDPEMAANQLADVLENFQGRHRNLLETFEARADEMEDANDPRSPEQITHSLADIIRFRLLMISAGYEDGNDASNLRGDTIFKMALDLSPSDRELCSQSTISRLENLPVLRMGRL